MRMIPSIEREGMISVYAVQLQLELLRWCKIGTRVKPGQSEMFHQSHIPMLPKTERDLRKMISNLDS